MDAIRYRYPGRCPVCGQDMSVNRLNCTHCQIKLEGDFALCKFCRLSNEQAEFVETFIKCRGNIKDVEKELGISYPTVRSRLDGVIQALGYRVDRVDAQEEKEEGRQKVLSSLEKGEITAQEAVKQLKKMGK